MRSAAAIFFAALIAIAAGCSSTPSRPVSNPPTNESSTTSTSAASFSPPPTSQSAVTLASFPTPASVNGWFNVDDSVMGGVSASEGTWVEAGGTGALLFSGTLSTERNGGFASILGPTEPEMGLRASNTTAISISAIGDGRTYLLQLRAGQNGNERWIARFTPPTARPQTESENVLIPFDAFEPVDRFLRPAASNMPLEASSIIQLAVYVLDGQVGEFRLAIERIDAVRL